MIIPYLKNETNSEEQMYDEAGERMDGVAGRPPGAVAAGAGERHYSFVSERSFLSARLRIMNKS